MALTPEERETSVALRQGWAQFRSRMDPIVLAWILQDSHFWSHDPSTIVPERIAFCNRLMGCMGIVTPDSMLRLAQALIASATDIELKKLEGET